MCCCLLVIDLTAGVSVRSAQLQSTLVAGTHAVRHGHGLQIALRSAHQRAAMQYSSKNEMLTLRISLRSAMSRSLRWLICGRKVHSLTAASSFSFFSIAKRSCQEQIIIAVTVYYASCPQCITSFTVLPDDSEDYSQWQV